jgi:hypothetical protein
MNPHPPSLLFFQSIGEDVVLVVKLLAYNICVLTFIGVQWLCCRLLAFWCCTVLLLFGCSLISGVT